MSEIKRTAKDLKEAREVIRQLRIDHCAADSSKSLTEIFKEDDQLFFRVGGKPVSVTIQPTPEFEKGTFGKFDGGGGTVIYDILDHIKGNVYYSENHICAEIFTPVYQNDPVFERAFDNVMLDKRRSGNCNKCDLNNKCKAGRWKRAQCVSELKSHFMARAKRDIQ